MAKIKLGEFVEYGQLFEVYGALLSNDRQKIMAEYFDFNMTLAEIAKSRQISRQAVLDAISKSCQKLKEYENLLGFLKLREKVFQKLDQIEKIEPKLHENIEDLKGEF